MIITKLQATNILNNRGKILSVLASTQKYPNIRKLFSLTIRLYASGRIKQLSSITEITETKNMLVKLNKQELKEYTKTLVPLGFPKVEGVVVRKISRRVAGADLPEFRQEDVMNVLQDHIDYLQEESFFQKAHKEAKSLNIIDRSESARIFYHDYAINYSE